jgi:hypothetical protein
VADRRAGHRGQEAELLPQCAPDVGRELDADARLRARVAERRRRRRVAAVERADDEPRHRAGVRDDARLADRGRDVRDAAQHMRRSNHPSDDVGRVDPVLERNDDSAARDERRDLQRRRLDVPQLHAQHDDVARRDARDVAGKCRVADRRGAESAFDDEAALAQRGEMRAPRDERHVVSRLREPAAEIPADAAGADHRNAHAFRSIVNDRSV